VKACGIHYGVIDGWPDSPVRGVPHLLGEVDPETSASNRHITQRPPLRFELKRGESDFLVFERILDVPHAKREVFPLSLL
jgi:hypothetical protein